MGSTSVPPPAADVLPSEVERDPDLWLRWLAWLVVIFSAAQILLFSFGPDQSAYAVVAGQLLDGQAPYRDVWDPRPPGIFLIHAASFAIFGETMAAPRVAEVLVSFGVVLGCRRLGGVLFQSRTGGLMGGAIAALVHAQLDFWHSGQPENFGGALVLFAAVLTTHPWTRHQAPWGWAAVGGVFGLAALFVPHLALGAIATGAFLAVRRKRDGRSLLQSLLPVLVIGTATFVPLVFTAVWLGILGAADDAWWALVHYSSSEVRAAWAHQGPPRMFFRALQKGFFDFSGLFTAGVIASAAVHPRADNERQGLLLIVGLVSIDLASVALQGELEPHDFAASIPLVGLMAGHGLYKLWRRIGPGSLVGTLAFASFLAVLPVVRVPVEDLPEGFWDRSRIRLSYLLGAGRTISREELDRRLYFTQQYRLDDAREAAHVLARTLPRGSRIYVWGFEPAVYWLSGMQPSSRFIHNLPHVGSGLRHHLRDALLDDLRSSPPEMVVVRQQDHSARMVASPVVRGGLDHFPELQQFLELHFERQEPVAGFYFWKRKS